MSEVFEQIASNSEIWVPFVSAVFGGLLSLVGALVTTGYAAKLGRKAEADANEQKGAESAFAVMFHLLEGHNSIANLQRQIHEMFEEADASEIGELPPWGKVRAFAGASHILSDIDPKETSFLINEKKADLINDIHLVQRRMRNILSASETYNQLRIEFQKLLETKVVEGQLVSGTVIAASFEGKERAVAEYHEARLNSLLGQIMDMLEQDVSFSWKVIGDFKSAAEQRYGSKFPRFQLNNPICT